MLILNDYGFIVHGLAQLHCLDGPEDNGLVRASGGSLGFGGGKQLADFPADRREERRLLRRPKAQALWASLFPRGKPGLHTQGPGCCCLFWQRLPQGTFVSPCVNRANEEATAVAGPEPSPCLWRGAEDVLLQFHRTGGSCCKHNTRNSYSSQLPHR